MTPTTAVEILPATFARVLEVARASLDGLEMIALTSLAAQTMPEDRLIAAVAAVAIARAELAEIERWPAGGRQTQQIH